MSNVIASKAPMMCRDHMSVSYKPLSFGTACNDRIVNNEHDAGLHNAWQLDWP